MSVTASPAMAAYEFTARGEVQAAGYRRLVQRAARSLGLKGYVENRPDGSVAIVAEGPRSSLRRFMKEIEVREPPILVERVERRKRRPTGRFKAFRVKPGSIVQELQEGLGAGEAQLRLLREDFGDYRREFRDHRKEFSDYRREFGEFRGETGRSFQSVQDRYGELSQRLAEAVKAIQEESMRTRVEMVRAVDNLAKLVDDFIRQRRGE